MKTQATKTRVIFRKFKEGDIIALFPDEPWNHTGWECASYQHLGQHGAADPRIVGNTKPATPDEYASLKKELESMKYDLCIMQKFPQNAYAIRIRNLPRIPA